MQNPLGKCQAKGQDGRDVCDGELCVSGREVRCERCGAEAPGHPALAAPAAPQAAYRDVQAADMAATVPDRVGALERRVAALEAAARAGERAGEKAAEGGRKRG